MVVRFPEIGDRLRDLGEGDSVVSVVAILFHSPTRSDVLPRETRLLGAILMIWIRLKISDRTAKDSFHSLLRNTDLKLKTV